MPSITRYAPAWRALGYSDHSYGRRYWYEIDGRTVRAGPAQVHGMGWLLTIYPDPEHWRRQFPRPDSPRRIDTAAATRYFLQAALAAGEYLPHKG